LLGAGEVELDGKAGKEMRALWRVVEKEIDYGKAHAGNRLGTEGTAATAVSAAVGR
jgi:hypothetical protein